MYGHSYHHYYFGCSTDLNCGFYSCHPFVPLSFLVVVQGEILQQPRPADLYAHHTPADALLPRQ